MSHPDYQIVLFLNQFVHRSWTLDTVLFLCVSSPLLRGAPIAILIWWEWFKEARDQRKNREILLYGIIACVGAVFLARAVAHVLPFRLQPLHNPDLVLRIADDIPRNSLWGWSSFPSDHAALLFTLVTSLWLISRSTGAVAFAQVLFLVCVPQVFLGLHYPSDIIGGALIGVCLALPGRSATIRGRVASRALQWVRRSPKHFYAAFFFATYMIGTVFDPAPQLLHFAGTVARALVFKTYAIYVLFPTAADRLQEIEGTVVLSILLVTGLLAVVIRFVWLRRRHSEHSKQLPI